MLNTTEQEKDQLPGGERKDEQQSQSPQSQQGQQGQMKAEGQPAEAKGTEAHEESVEGEGAEIHHLERRRGGARGTAAMDPQTRKEVARKGGLAVSRNRQHMSEIGRKGGQSVSKNREHMAKIGRKGGAASRGGGQGEQG